MPPDKEENEARWAQERARYLSSSEVGLREKVAQAVAWSELGYSHHGIANRLDTRGSTAERYLDIAEGEYPGSTYRIRGVDFDDVDSPPWESAAPPSRTCPCCTEDRVLTPEEAKRIFLTSDWGSSAMLEDAELVCSYCHAVRIDGVWRRMESADSRAWKLSQNGGTKDVNDYRELLTRGIDAGREKPTAEGAEGW